MPFGRSPEFEPGKPSVDSPGSSQEIQMKMWQSHAKQDSTAGDDLFITA